MGDLSHCFWTLLCHKVLAFNVSASRTDTRSGDPAVCSVIGLIVWTWWGWLHANNQNCPCCSFCRKTKEWCQWWSGRQWAGARWLIHGLWLPLKHHAGPGLNAPILHYQLVQPIFHLCHLANSLHMYVWGVCLRMMCQDSCEQTLQSERMKASRACVYRRYQPLTWRLLTKEVRSSTDKQRQESSGRLPPVTSQWLWTQCSVWHWLAANRRAECKGRAWQMTDGD